VTVPSLTVAEQFLVESAVRTGAANFGRAPVPIRAFVVAAIVRGEARLDGEPAKRLSLVGAQITGPLDLTTARTEFAFAALQCDLEHLFLAFSKSWTYIRVRIRQQVSYCVMHPHARSAIDSWW
jgi:hypothetical protein